MAENDLRNAFRYPGKGTWFDFWNCRILIPEKNQWFFIMPHILSIDNIQTAFFYHSSSSAKQVYSNAIDNGLEVSRKDASLSWEENFFSSNKIDIKADGFRWNFEIQRICSDGINHQVKKRIFDVRERMLLRNNSFIHYVPTMKGVADGFIETPSEKIKLDRAIIYQAKNHGTGFPQYWRWLHVNHMPQFPESAFEIGTMPGRDGTSSFFRWADKNNTEIYSTFSNDTLYFEQNSNTFEFGVLDKEGNEVIKGTAHHGNKKLIAFPTPNKKKFQTPESFDGRVYGHYKGVYFDSKFPALGKGVTIG